MPRIIKMNDNGEHDVDMSQADVQIEDCELFSEKEKPSVQLFNTLLRCKHELKSHMQTLRTGNLFIEFEIDNLGNGRLKPSGLSTTKSDYYFLNIGDMALNLPTKFLRWLLEHKDDDDIDLKVRNNSKTATDHIGYGLLIPGYRIIELYNKYNEYMEQQRVQEVLKNLRRIE